MDQLSHLTNVAYLLTSVVVLSSDDICGNVGPINYRNIVEFITHNVVDIGTETLCSVFAVYRTRQRILIFSLDSSKILQRIPSVNNICTGV